MAVTNNGRVEAIKDNYKRNTIEMIIDGKKCRVNKFEADDLKKKLAAMSKK